MEEEYQVIEREPAPQIEDQSRTVPVKTYAEKKAVTHVEMCIRDSKWSFPWANTRPKRTNSSQNESTPALYYPRNPYNNLCSCLLYTSRCV